MCQISISGSLWLSCLITVTACANLPYYILPNSASYISSMSSSEMIPKPLEEGCDLEFNTTQSFVNCILNKQMSLY